MVATCARVTLKSGEPMDVIKTTAPEPAWTDRILPFLTHKGEHWLGPMREAYDRGLDDLVMNDFLGVLDSGEVIGNITTVEHRGVGVLQHVFTPPAQRRKGICSALMTELCRDFVARGGRAMSLSTGYDTPPYHLYEGYGFCGRGDSGKMTWLPDATFLETYFAGGDTTIRDTRWEDWAPLEALYAVTGQWQLKGVLFEQIGHADYEGEYPRLRRMMCEGTVLRTRVMQKADGAVVGHALLARQPLWQGKVLLCDLMVHASFQDRAAALLAALELPAGSRVQAFCDERAEAKMRALEATGFAQEGVFPNQIEDEDHRPMAVVAYGRG